MDGRRVILLLRRGRGDGNRALATIVAHVAHRLSAEHEVAEGGSRFVLAHGIVLGLPAVEGDDAVGADDVVVLVRRLDEREESRAGELLGRGLVFVELPVELPLQERRDPVMVLEVGLEVALDLCLFRRHVGGRIELEKVGCERFRWGCEGTGRVTKEGTMLTPEV